MDGRIDPVVIKLLGMVVVVVAIYADTERWLVVLNAVLRCSRQARSESVEILLLGLIS